MYINKLSQLYYMVTLQLGQGQPSQHFFFSCFNRQCHPLSPSLSDEALDPFGFPPDLLCSKDSVAELLTSLDLSKSAGINGISAKMLCFSAYSIASSLMHQIESF